MPVHHGGKVGQAGKTLSSKNSTQQQKTDASKTLNRHKTKYH